MTNSNFDIHGSVQDFFKALQEIRGISALSEKIHHFLCSLQQTPPIEENAQKVLYLFFSLLEDGNTRIILDSNRLFAKWEKKWSSLVIQSQSKDEYNGVSPRKYIDANEFADIIQKGIEEILKGKYNSIIGALDKPLQIVKDENFQYLTNSRFVEDTHNIETVFQSGIFKEGQIPSANELQAGKRFVKQMLRSDSKIEFDDCQAECIVRGINENLIITGGPGTGKTTVIGFLLWKLFAEKPETLKWNLYMAAPSGKAADRLLESMDDVLREVSEEDRVIHHDISNKLKNAESYTLHRLLKYSPAKNGFTYSAQNPLPEKSIYIVDEASMIDISLFAAFLQALPKKNFKLFILGDPNQLPSVDAGAVLGNILQFNKNFVIPLKKSNRFNDQSKIGILARQVQNGNAEFQNEEFNPNVDYWEKEDSIYHFSLEQNANKLSHKEELHHVEAIVKKWTKKFYLPLIELAKNVDPSIDEDLQQNQCDKLWFAANNARILAAERRGNRGIETINNIVCENLSQSHASYFVGQILMLNRNQNEFKLYNGDSGIVVKSPKNDQPFIMFRKLSKYVFFPISALPGDSLESAFAITIHKSQGSGYPHIMMFLPRQKGHPLLNREILYTGITRTKKMSLTIVSTPEAFRAACTTITERDTGIAL